MNEILRTAAVEGEAPVNPYSLLEAVNASSETAHTGWLIFIGIMSYLLIAVAGVTHKDLLLGGDIQLPILQVKIDLTRFFLFAPILLVVFHLGLVTQLVMLARKALEFDTSIRMLEVSDKRSHPLRLELSNFFFVQTVAGPERSLVMSLFLHAMSWLSLVILPVAMLLYVQVAFLPYHDTAITWVHRIALVADVVMLAMIGVFLMRPETSFLGAAWQTTRWHPISAAATFALFGVILVFSFVVGTVPGEPLDRITQGLRFAGATPFQSDRAAYGFVMPFLGARADGSLFGLFERNLNVADADLVVDRDVTPNEPTVILRGRDLRYARLDRIDLHQADLTGADLDGASLVGADFRNVQLQCSDLNQLILADSRKTANCASARGTNFTRARLNDARMSGIDLTDAKVEEADLEGADLSHATLVATSFYSANLARADLSGGVLAPGANFATALLQGADLTGARLAGADFTSAGLQAVALSHAYLYGASLRDADMEGADLSYAKLQGSDLALATLKAVDLRATAIWWTSPPDREAAVLADFAGVMMEAPDDQDKARLNRLLGRVDEPLRSRLSAKLAKLVGPGAKPTWTEQDQQGWQTLSLAAAAARADNYKVRLTEQLQRLACKTRWSNGSVAAGVARRALTPDFGGDLPALYDRMKMDDCPGAKAMPQRVLRNLATATDQARGN